MTVEFNWGIIEHCGGHSSFWEAVPYVLGYLMS